MCYFVDKSIYFFTRDANFQLLFTFYSLFSLNFHFLGRKFNLIIFSKMMHLKFKMMLLNYTGRGEKLYFFGSKSRLVPKKYAFFIIKFLSTFYQVLIHFCALEIWLLTILSLFKAV